MKIIGTAYEHMVQFLISEKTPTILLIIISPQTQVYPFGKAFGKLYPFVKVIHSEGITRYPR